MPDDPTPQLFTQALDLACGRMVRLGLAREAMVELAQELACMLSNDSFSREPQIPQSRELYRLMVAVKCHLEGRHDGRLNALVSAVQNPNDIQVHQLTP